MAKLDPGLYTVAWIAPLEIEAKAALYMLERIHEGKFPMDRGDDYIFQAGELCGHNIIIATLPASIVDSLAVRSLNCSLNELVGFY
jgi:hypothetical protein